MMMGSCIDKIIEGNYQNYVIDKLTGEITSGIFSSKTLVSI